MQIKCIQGLSLVWCWLLFLLYIFLPSREPSLAEAQIYTSRNECISESSVYDIQFTAVAFSIQQNIKFTTMSPVTSCYFYVEDFIFSSVILYEKGRRQLIGIDEIDDKTLVLKLVKGFFQPNTNYTVVFHMIKVIERAGEGLIFKVYRDLYSMKTNWYAIVKIGPAQCGKVYVCINNLLSFQKLTIRAHYPTTHRLHCPGKITQLKPKFPNLHSSQCENTLKVGVNNMHFSVANFHHLNFTTYETSSPEIFHRINLVSPRDKLGFIYLEIINHFNLIKRIYSMLTLWFPLDRFNVYFYFLPIDQHFEPLVLSGVCLFSFQDIQYNIEIESTIFGYLRCLAHQGWMNERVMNSWTLRFALEGLAEVFLSQFQVAYTYSGYFRDCVEGKAVSLSPLANYYEDGSLVRFEGPWRKAAGFFFMLSKVSGKYGDRLIESFVKKQVAVETYSKYINWLVAPSKDLHLNQSQFLDMLYSWTETDGYPVIQVAVPIKRMICVNQYNVGSYFRSYVLPIQVTYNFPEKFSSPIWWTDPRSMHNCRELERHSLYPYLVNAELNMVARVLYDKANWEKWASKLMSLQMRNSLRPMQISQLVTDALYFAARGQLSYAIAMKFFFVMRVETNELSWRNFDSSLTFLEAQTRYTSAYPLFRKMMVDVTMRFFNESYLNDMPYLSVAIKWACWMGNAVCRNYVKLLTQDTLQNALHRPKIREVLCAGMRSVTFAEYRAIVHSLGRPDWREPDFYVDVLMCAEDKHVLRDLMFYLFFDNTWKFRRSRLTTMLVKMIRMSKPGSNMALFYLRHDPVGMIKLLGFENFLEVIHELANYMRQNYWFVRMVKRLRMTGLVDRDLFVQYRPIMNKLRENKRWFNTKYDIVYQFLSHDYAQLLPWTELEDGLQMDPFPGQPDGGGL